MPRYLKFTVSELVDLTALEEYWLVLDVGNLVPGCVELLRVHFSF